MTDDEIWDWQCKMHLWSCYLYEVEAKPAIDDGAYDKLCLQLLSSWDKLPSWYRERVDKGDLKAGTGAAIAWSLSEDEAAEARWWRDEHIPAMKREMEERRTRLEAGARLSSK